MRWLPVSLLLLGSALRASEPAPTPAPPTDSIAETRRDFEAIRATAAGMPEARADAPHIETPEMLALEGVNGGRASLPRSGPVPSPLPDGNWLVDAMAQSRQAPGASAGARPGGSKYIAENPAGGRLTGAQSALEAGSQAAATGGQVASQRADNIAQMQGGRSNIHRDGTGLLPGNGEAGAAGAVVNPLSGYMAGWMTPRDFALLKPNDRGSAIDATRDILRESATLDGRASAATAGTNSFLAGTTNGNSPGWMARGGATPEQNPYVQDFAAVPAWSAPPISTPAKAPATSGGLGVILSAPGPRQDVPATRSTIPDFAKPTDDSKYFQGLKRF